MAHSCPICDMLCHCGGDIDDICLDDTLEQDRCTHYRECDSDYDDDDDDDDDDDFDFWDDLDDDLFDNYYEQQESRLHKWKKKHPRRCRIKSNRKSRKYYKGSFFNTGYNKYRICLYSNKSKVLANRVFDDENLPF